MKIPILIQLMIFNAIFSLAVVTLAGEGHETGNGNDNHSIEYGSAWFVGSSPLKYCFEHEKGFGLSEADAIEQFNKALNKWQKYTEKHKIHHTDKATHGLNFNYVLNSTCDGTENLTVYLGVSNDRIEKRKATLSNPTAFVYRESYNSVSGLGTGFMWFALDATVYPGSKFPQWSQVDNFHGMALHEIGHLLGVPHIEGTIMSKSLTSWMQMSGGSDIRRKYVMNHIDDQNFLYTSAYSPIKDVEGTISYYGSHKAYEAQVYKELFGREAQGDISVSFSQSPNQLKFTDAGGTQTLYISSFANSAVDVVRSNNLFYSVRSIEGENIETKGYSHSSKATSQLIEFIANGKKYRGMLSINSDSLNGRVHITLFTETGVRNLFSAKTMGVRH